MAQDKLTDKQEAFAQGIAAGKTASDAYRGAYKCDGMGDKTVWARASELRKDSKVTVRIDELRSQNEKQELWTRASIMERLLRIADEARQAISKPVLDGNGNVIGTQMDSQAAKVELQAADQAAKMIGAYEQKINARVSSQTIEDYLKTLDDD